MTVNQIYFSQHGLALDKTKNPDRPLSAEGIKQTQSIANQLKTSCIPVSKIFHSGKRRAQQTAEIFATALKTSKPIMFPGMSPMDDYEILINNLNTDHALYVGHLPYLDKVVSSLVTKTETKQIVQFKNSGIVCLTKNNNTYSIAWYLTPQITLSK